MPFASLRGLDKNAAIEGRRKEDARAIMLEPSKPPVGIKPKEMAIARTQTSMSQWLQKAADV